MTTARSIGRTARPVPSAEEIGRSSPLGATVVEGGVNFSLFSRTAAGVELVLFDREDDASPSRVVRIDPATNRTYHYWHVFLTGVSPGQLYGYRVEGPSDPAVGLRFGPAKVMLDPRHVRRADREDPVPPGPRHHGRRIAAGVRVRRPGVPAGAGQLLGLPAGLVLRATPGL